MLGTHACTAELGRDLIRQRQAEGIAVKRNHGGNVGGRPRVADVKTVKNWESPRLPRCRATAEAWKYLENLAEVQEREVGCLVEKIVGETDVNPYPLPYFREQDLAAEDARAARISNAMTRKVAFELTRLAIPYEFRFEEEAADDERLSEIWDM